MNIINLQRDFTHVILNATQLTYPASTAVAATIPVNADPTVYQDFGAAQSVGTATFSADAWSAIGCYLKEPYLDRTPYRVKAYTRATDAAVVVGYAPGTITGAGDIVTSVNTFPFDTEFDDILLLQPLTDADPDYQKPIFLGVAVYGEDTTGEVMTHVSVQNVSNAAPTFSASVS